MSQEDSPDYDNTHRAFLQNFMSRSTFTFETAKPVLAAILMAHSNREVLTEDVTESDFNSYVATVNKAISPFDLEIRSTFTQTAPRTRVYAFVNTTSDGIAQLATTHSPEEIAFVKRVLDAMFDTYNTPQRELMAVKGMQATNLHKGPRVSGVDGASAAGQGITAIQAERLLKSLVDEGWFEKSRDYCSLTPRALMELRGWLLETYNEPEDEEGGGVERVKLCQACREIVTIGQRCATRECAVRLHDHCTASFFRSRREERCPKCRKEWTGGHYVGIRADGIGRGGGGGRRGVQSMESVGGEQSSNV